MKKIKKLAKILCWVGIIISIVFGVVAIADEFVFVGLLIVALGSLVSWVSSFFMYGLGELITKTTEISKNTRDLNEILIEIDEIKKNISKTNKEPVSKIVVDEVPQEKEMKFSDFLSPETDKE